MHPDIAEILIAEDEIQAKIAELGERLSADYQRRPLVLIGILKGALLFMVDLARAIDLPLEMDFMAVSSYGASTKTTGVVRILKDADTSLEGRDVLVVEDIVDSGLTLRYIVNLLLSRRPSSLRVCTLLEKERARLADVPLDYVGFQIPDRFVVGYGLDYAERYRQLRYIGVLKPEVYERAGIDA